MSLCDKKTLLTYNIVLPEAPPDEQDVLIEVDIVSEALQNLGYDVVKQHFSLDVFKYIKEIDKINPALIFNLIESFGGKGNFIHFPVQIFEYLNRQYTGAGSDALFLTSNKVLAKKILSSHTILTPAWQTIDEIINQGLTIKPPYILKPIYEDASVDIHDDSIFYNTESFIHRIGEINWCEQKGYFVEHFIEGREINVSILANGRDAEILPPAEILFEDFPSEKPKIVGYDAKWNKNSFEYTHTQRTFNFSECDVSTLEQIKHISQECWKLFQLKGYARIDFRIDRNGVPWVLEINANPCISPDSGFVAAAEEAGFFAYESIIKRIVEDALAN